MTFPQFFDVHAHVNDVRFDDDRNAVLERMQDRSVWAIMIGTDRKTSQSVAMMASFGDAHGVYAAIGVHPIDNPEERFMTEFFDELALTKRVVAVGECGLDYSRLPATLDVLAEKTRQKELFLAQIDFAVKHNLPLMIHCRDSDKAIADAHRDVLAILRDKKTSTPALSGNIHFFSQTIDIAREYFALGFTISFTGVITFSREYDEVVRLSPLDRIMSETDCPYVPPIPYRGKRNEPIYVEEVVKKIAEIRGEDFETVRAALVQNAFRTLNIPLPD
ncbi:MAG: Hydrolase, TatD family [Parcubacteria group bacterium GW2011_GWA1_47_8]|nr:MAG: Hydrolase, TatD family [Parcubacteria group bacterium GW2011_GWA1_47_8]KKW07983.1 MAG: Hydrolase, TatD family [Parcubacteria group bacterium GW2011_GWA2_49_16]